MSDAGERPGVRRLAGEPPSPWEAPYGFSRAVVLPGGPRGGLVLVGGTTSVEPSGVVLGETPYEQAVLILAKLEHELARVGASLSDVVRTRVYVTDISRADEVGRAHGERFGPAPPVMSMIEVSGLIDPRMLVEIEAEALLP